MVGKRASGLTAQASRHVSLTLADELAAAAEEPKDQEFAGSEPEADQPPLAGIPGLPLAAVAEPETDLTQVVPAGSPARDDVRQLNSTALAKFSTKDYAAAIDLLARALQLEPNSAAAHNNLALALWRAKRGARAEALSRRAIAIDPHYTPAHRLLCEVLRERHDVAEALACYERLFVLEPDNVIARNNVGLLLRKAGRFDEAAAAFAQARALMPDDPAIRFNQLSLQADGAALNEAIACCQALLERQRDSAEILTNLAVTFQFANRIDEAMDCMERAVASDPANCQASFNLSLLLLLRGDYQRGWREYERRWGLPEVTKPQYPQPEWTGEDLDGKTILLQQEQGLGDTIQCLRYVPLVVERGGKVVLRVARTLVRLAASLPSKVAITTMTARVPAFDVWCPLMSLPRIFGTRADTIPLEVPYLTVRAPLAERWRKRLATLPKLKVGLVWAGNPLQINDFRRSIRFDTLKRLLEVPHVSFVSLQVGPRAADLAELLHAAIVDLSTELSDFAETAGAVLNLDLVIAVDTAVAHLAGALGKPVWLMLPFSPDWRWLLDRPDSPWYPTMRLYRQRTPGDWDDVVARIAADLAAHAAAHANTQSS
jgi:Flp pilus assembly protein TadD